jgi:putative heme-binding domain-containing protein
MLRLALCLGVILLGGAGQLPAQAHSDSLLTGEAGARLYFAYCSACHGAEGNGIPGVDFRSGKFRRASSDDDLMLIVLRGIPGTAMPPNNFGSSELRAIVSYLRSLPGAHLEALPGDARRGETIFEGRAGCLDCHRVNGRGSYAATDLSDIGIIRSIDYLGRSLVDPAVSDSPEHRRIRAVTRDGVAVSGRRLNEDTFTVQLIDSKGNLVSLRKPELKVYEVIKGSTMPSYRERLSPAELEDLVRYLYSLKGPASR